MKYNQLGTTSLLVSELCLGTMTFGGSYGRAAETLSFLFLNYSSNHNAMLISANSRRCLTAALLVTLCLCLGFPASSSAQSSASREAQNKQLIQQAFDQWADGSGNFFDLLADDIQWTIAGSSSYSKTYTGKQQFLDQAAKPLTVRLATPIVPKVHNLYADGDVVVAIWEGAATVKDGKPYRNTYSWVMKLQNGRITQVLAFLDMVAYEDVINRIPAGK